MIAPVTRAPRTPWIVAAVALCRQMLPSLLRALPHVTAYADIASAVCELTRGAGDAPPAAPVARPPVAHRRALFR